MHRSALAFTCILGLAFATPLVAQDIGSHPAESRGRRSIVVDTNASWQIGYWTRRSDRTDLGLDLGLQGLFREGATRFHLALTPALKRYHSSVGPLAPYTYAGIPLSYTRSDSGTPDDGSDFFGVGIALGFGLEWLPVPQVSIGGHVGGRVSYDGIGNDDSQLLSVSTASSGIRVHLYF